MMTFFKPTIIANRAEKKCPLFSMYGFMYFNGKVGEKRADHNQEPSSEGARQ